MSVNELLKEKRGEIPRIAAKHGARNVRLFGSAARGEADEQSDLDFLVEMEAGRFWTCKNCLAGMSMS
jgi:predicted nucleotidyltransferase